MTDFISLFAIDVEPDTAGMADRTIERGPAHPSHLKKADLSEHLRMIELEFSGRTVLEFYHAGLIIHIRRNIHADIHFQRFLSLWTDHTDFLLQKLNSRWLVSACDTLADMSQDSTERAAALSGTLFVNTVKLYETERRALNITSTDYEPIDGQVQLFDGLSAFWLGKGNMVFNLMQRMAEPFPEALIAPQIVRELVRRMRRNDTVFSRFAAVHQFEPTGW